MGFYGFPILIYSHSTRNNEQLAAKVERAERFSETRGRPTYASLGLASEAVTIGCVGSRFPSALPTPETQAILFRR